MAVTQVRQPQGSNEPEQSLHEELGRRISVHRKLCGLSQARLAQALGISFQQIQKYESGQNRISAVALAQIAPILGTSIADLLDGLTRAPSKNPPRVTAWLEQNEGVELGHAFIRIDDPTWRKIAVSLVNVLADHACRERAGADDGQDTNTAEGTPTTRRRG